MMQTHLLKALTFVILMMMTGYCYSDDYDLDPDDMINFDHSNMRMKNQPEQPPEEMQSDEQTNQDPPPKSDGVKAINPTDDFVAGTGHQDLCKSCPTGVPYIREYVKVFHDRVRRRFDASVQDYDIRVHLTKADMKSLKRFAETSDGSLMDVTDILKNMIKSVSKVDSESVNRREWIENQIGVPLLILLQMLAVTALAIIIVYLEIKMNVSWRKKVGKLLVILFVFSIPWTWYELYKKEEIKQHAAIMKNAPPECQGDEKELNMYQMATHVISSYFTFKQDKCNTYYEHVLMDPMWKVTPTQAVAVTFVRFFVTPAKYVGEAISQFLTSLLKDLPIQMMPIALGLVAFFFLIIIFMGFGYRIRLPLIAVEPMPASTDKKFLQMFEKNEKQLEDVQASMKSIKSHQEQSIEDVKAIEAETLTKRDLVDVIMKCQQRGEIQPPRMIASDDNHKVKDICDDETVVYKDTVISSSSSIDADIKEALDKFHSDDSHVETVTSSST